MSMPASGVAGSSWRTSLFDGYDPDTGIYEQFSGLRPARAAGHRGGRASSSDRRRPAARGRATRGAQVIKQADVLMLHHLVPDEVVPGSLEPNLRFYEPRTAHGSSLSPAIHASLLARARDFDRALQALRIAVRMDLDDLTGSTAQGLHLATMGGAWQALAFGFAGLRPRAGMLHIDPVLPPSWSALDLRVPFHGSRVRVRIERAQLSIWADRRIAVVVGVTRFAVGPGKLAFRRRGPRWEPVENPLMDQPHEESHRRYRQLGAARPVLTMARALAAALAGTLEALHVSEDGDETARVFGGGRRCSATHPLR